MSDKYILIDNIPVPCENLQEWAEWFEKAKRHVAKTEFEGFYISTVFLGMNHSFSGGRPILFETMIFGDGAHEDDEYQERYCTWAEAEAGHEKAVEMVMEKHGAIRK